MNIAQGFDLFEFSCIPGNKYAYVRCRVRGCDSKLGFSYELSAIGMPINFIYAQRHNKLHNEEAHQICDLKKRW